MQRNTFNHRTGSSAIAHDEIYDYGQEHYYDLLQEAEQQRLERRATRASANGQPALQPKSPFSRLLMWVGLF